MRLAIGIVLLVVAAVATPPARAAFPGENGRIAYVRSDPLGCEGDDIVTVDPDGTDVQPRSCGSLDGNPAWSPDGKYLAWNDGTFAIVSDEHGQLTPGDVVSDEEPAWSPDGGKIVFSRFDDLVVMNSDGTGVVPLGVAGHDASWSPDGTRIAFERAGDVFTVDPDGTDQTQLTFDTGDDGNPNWSPDGTLIAFHSSRGGTHAIWTMNADGSGQAPVSGASPGLAPAWSPDGAKIAYQASGIRVIAATGGSPVTIVPIGGDIQVSDPDWQPLPINAYARPKGATPSFISLVPAFSPCSAPNRTHGAPLAFGSCAPPTPRSSALTVGTPDANGKPAKSSGLATLATKVGNPSTAADEADVRLVVRITDVRSAGDLSDYTGSLEAHPTLRITDRDNTPSPGGPGAATVADLPFAFAVPCSPTLDATVGSTCAVETTADTVLPGAVKEGRRAIWALGAFEVRDAAGSAFMTQGLFVP